MVRSFRGSVGPVSGAFWLLFASLALTACGDVGEDGSIDDGEGDPETESSTDELRRGARTFRRPEVGMITFASGGWCTGTLIHPRAVLTAAHCVKYRSNAAGGRALGTFWIVRGGQRYQFKWDGYRSFGTHLGGDDVAVLRLERRVPSIVARPAPIASSSPSNGARATVYGYGYYRCNYGGEGGRADGYKRQLTFSWGSDPAALCPGDSGGPTFVNGQVVQVSSGHYVVPGQTRVRDIYARVWDNRSQILGQVASWD